MHDTTEHDKLQSVQEPAQTIGEFLEWLEARGIFLCHLRGDEYYRTRCIIEELLASYFGIDLDKIEDEKRAMLKDIRTSRNATLFGVSPHHER